MNLTDIDLNELDFQNVAAWPLPVRIFVLALAGLLVAGLGYWFLIKDELLDLDRAARHEQALKEEFRRKAAKAANLDAYKRQLEEMRQSFGAMLRQLPNRTEVAELLVDVSQTGLASGLEFDLFKPQEEVPREFYAELPIRIRVKGKFHQFGNFVSGVASLPRIVTVHDIHIERQQQGKSGKDAPPVNAANEALIMELTAKTYRYLEEDEQRAEGDKK
ncbi:MAG: pilus assembly protein PilO [Gammaproteobacteria bacterium]|nr:MAG: pilus assembly protein PilO [Gammaproteobacteria bacterium]